LFEYWRCAERARRRRQTNMFEVTARLKVREGELEGFRRQAAEMMRLTSELDTKTVRYDWFLSDDEAECEVREAYADADALIEHSQHIAETRNKLFRDFADGHTITFYAEPSPALAKAMEAMPPGAVTVKQFFAFQPDAEVAEQVSA
jgi:quinol monooxygenase YgiN